MSQVTDRETEAAILEYIKNDSRVDEDEIEVHVEEGTVYLMGRVDSAAERQAVEEDVQAAAHVEDMIDQITLRNYVERSDQELKEEVKHALMRDPTVDVEQIEIGASNGEVLLRGQIDTYAQKTAIEDIVWWTSGVTNVVSHLAVTAQDVVPEDLKE
jgi:osmotically-inducible protein OsmY